jgi:hypothetical protein
VTALLPQIAAVFDLLSLVFGGGVAMLPDIATPGGGPSTEWPMRVARGTRPAPKSPGPSNAGATGSSASAATPTAKAIRRVTDQPVVQKIGLITSISGTPGYQNSTTVSGHGRSPSALWKWLVSF